MKFYSSSIPIDYSDLASKTELYHISNLSASVNLSVVFLTLNTKYLRDSLKLANLGISFVQDISLCLKSDTKIVHFKENLVFLQAKQQKYAALSITISFSELIVPDNKNCKRYSPFVSVR